tara:strand:- start:20 stop:325 length:306 start_codon:yes stop_codon:yes gene_type:complete
MKVIYVDIDGVLCENTDGDYESAKPINSNIKKINKLFLNNRIILWTARGTTTGIDWHSLTSKQMEKWGVLHHELHLGKPFYDIWIDDKCLNILDIDSYNFK